MQFLVIKYFVMIGIKCGSMFVLRCNALFMKNCICAHDKIDYAMYGSLYYMQYNERPNLFVEYCILRNIFYSQKSPAHLCEQWLAR